MKNFITNIEEATELTDQISEFDDVSMMSIICALIDIISARSKEPVLDIVVSIEDAVLTVNEVLWPYNPGTREEHDYKN